MRKYISPHYLLSGLLGMLALVLSVSCDDTDVVRRVDPQIEVQADLFTGPAASRQVLPLHSTYPWFAEASASWIKLSWTGFAAGLHCYGNRRKSKHGTA